MAVAEVTIKKEKGHESHTQNAEAKGLPGKILRPIKITMLGAGSGFTPRLVNDVLKIPGADAGTIALVDIDTERLSTMTQLIGKLIEKEGKTGWTVVGSADRTQVLPGSDYVVCCVEVSGTACVQFDNDIPLKYGIDQCIGDTIGPGGLFKALRTVPVFLQILKDVERLCPGAIVLNYTNPMNIMCLAAGRSTDVPVVGLCHSVQGTGHLLAKRAGVVYEEMEWECAGINHLAWFTKLRHMGKDLYPILMDKARKELAGQPTPSDEKPDLVRKDMMLHFGAFITESSGHLSEYLHYYRKNSDAMKTYIRHGYCGESRFYASNWPTWRKNADADRKAMIAGEKPFTWERSWEYASWIIEAREKDTPFRIHGNVMNNLHRRNGDSAHLITNLPGDGCVEVACMIDRNGINPTRYGRLPAQMAHICASNMAMFDLAATACIEKSVDAAVHALLLDPLSQTICTPAQIKAMTLELFAAEKEFLPGFK